MTPRRHDPHQLVGQPNLGLGVPGGTHRVLPTPVPSGSVRAATPIVLPPMIGASKQEIKARVELLVVQFLCDDSGSMYGAYGDRDGVRYAAALSLLRLMERAGGGRCGVVHWGTDAPSSLALAPVDIKRGRRALKQALTVPPTLGGNNLPLALTRARKLMPRLADNEQSLTLVLSDGIEPVTPAMHAAVAALPPRSVHMLLVDRSGGCNTAMEQAWSTVAFGSFHRLNVFDTKVMAFQLAEILADSIGLQMPARPKTDTKNRSTS